MPFATQWHAKHKLKLMAFGGIVNRIAMQRHRVHAPFSINISGIINAFATQCHEYCGKFSMNESLKMIILTTQLGTSCVFDSPGLARNEPTPGKRLQGDSTP